MGTWLATLLVLTLGQTPSDVFFSNQRNYRIPIDIAPAVRQELRELLLFASSDQGRNWQQVAVVPADRDAFVFHAPTDGEYWFKVAAVTRQGKQEPENINQGPPQQKMVVDTLKPLIRINSAQRLGDEIVVSWEIQEDHPDWSGMRIEYQDKASPSLVWTPVQGTPALRGQARFRPTTSAALAVRVTARDRAGNVGFATAEVAGGTGLMPASFNEPAQPIVPAPAGPPLTPINPPKIAPPPTPNMTPLDPKGPAWSVPPVQPSAPTYPPAAPKNEPNQKPVATSEVANPAAASPYAAPRKQLPAAQYVNSPEVTLEYDISKVGPSGIASVELWMTQNDGQTWERYAWDPEVKGITGAGRQQRTIELPGDGIYGFNLIVKSRAGMGKAPPRPGDTPEMRIEVDTIPPAVQLYSPVPDTQKSNTLVLSWTARDNNLAQAPVTLEWAERRDDNKWHPIAANLPNSGRHAWLLPDSLPVQVYLRIRVRDLAGNESIAVTPEPQVVDLTEPEGRLVGVSVLPKRP